MAWAQQSAVHPEIGSDGDGGKESDNREERGQIPQEAAMQGRQHDVHGQKAAGLVAEFLVPWLAVSRPAARANRFGKVRPPVNGVSGAKRPAVTGAAAMRAEIDVGSLLFQDTISGRLRRAPSAAIQVGGHAELARELRMQKAKAKGPIRTRRTRPTLRVDKVSMGVSMMHNCGNRHVAAQGRALAPLRRDTKGTG